MTRESRQALKPTLGLVDATAIGVGAIIGAGIFVVTGIAAAHAGSAVVVSMIIAAAISLMTALSFAELTAWMPKEGSVYELARRLISPFVGFLTGWMWMLSNTFAGATVSLGFAAYVSALFPGVPATWLPRAILLSLAISTALYVAVGLVAVGLVGAARLSASGSPLTEAIAITGSRTAVSAVSAGGMLATASVLLTAILGVSRVAYAMARSGDLPGVFGRLHPTYDTPSQSVWITGVVMAMLVVFVDLTKVVAVSTFALLFYYGVANICALRLKPRDRVYPGSFRPSASAPVWACR